MKALSRDATKALPTLKHLSDASKSNGRNEYLVREGYIRPDSKQGQLLPAKDRAMRESSYKQRLQQLKKHAHFFLSPTRLSIRNLPKRMTEKTLKAVVRKYTTSWIERQMKEWRDGTLGRTERLEWAQLLHAIQPHTHLDTITPTSLSDTIKTAMKRLIVKQVKLIRDPSHMDRKSAGEDGKQVGVSRGYAFVEFTHHVHALACLRALNNQVDVDGMESRRPLVEFALENRLILKKREERKKRLVQKKDAMDRNIGKKEKRECVEKQETGKKKKNLAKNEVEKKREVKTKKETSKKENNEVKNEKKAEIKKKGEVKKKKETKNVADQKQQDGTDKKTKAMKNESERRQAKESSVPKLKRKEVEDQKFEDLVNKYKNRLMTSSTTKDTGLAAKRARWFE
jgi:nucleolar protein 4